MNQANGIGSRVSLSAIGIACVCAECIPVMIGATLIAACGVAWDFARGNVTDISGKRKSRLVSTNHKSAAQKNKNKYNYIIEKRKNQC